MNLWPFSRAPKPALTVLQPPAPRRALVEHRTAWGETAIHEADPEVETHDDVLLTPFDPAAPYDHDPSWGVYDADGALIEAAALRRGPSDALLGQSPRLEVRPPASVVEALPPGDYVYGGVIITHYGHFICTGLARLWWLAREGPGRRTVLFHSSDGVEVERERHPHIRACLDRLGLEPGRVMTIDRPLRVPRLVVPRPAFREQMFAHRVFRDLGHRIGAADWEPDPPPRGPVWLSKSRLAHGIHHLVNEHELDEALRALGVEVVHPEQMSFAEQVRLFSQNRTVMGTAGSAFHTGVFAPPAGRRICITQSARINANQILLDRVNDASASYAYPMSGVTPERDTGAFLDATRLLDPAGLARELCARAGDA